MDEQLIIRALKKDDFPKWKPLWDGYNAFYGRAAETSLAPEITQTTWSRFFDSYEPMHAMVVERSGELLGMAHFLYHRSTTQIAPTCYLQDLYTKDQARGVGVGRALINAVYEEARTAGVSRVYWQTRDTNITAMRLYDKVAEKPGFVIYHKLL